MTRQKDGLTSNGSAAGTRVDQRALDELVSALEAARRGDFSVRLPARRKGPMGKVAMSYNEFVRENERMARELLRVGRVIGREGRMEERASMPRAEGGWKDSIEALNSLIDDLVRPTTEVGRVISAVAEGDLSQQMALTIEGQQVKGEFLRIGKTVNAMVDQLSSFADEVTRVAREVGTEGMLGGQAEVEGVSGTWRDLTESVNLMASNLTDQVRNIVDVTTAVASGDLSQQITADVKGEVLELKNTVNTMVDQLSSFADEVTRVAREVGTEGKLGGQAEVEGVSGTWRDLTDNVNLMASNLTDQVRGIVDVTTAVANGDLSKKITVETKGEVGALADTINTMVDQLSSFADEVTRVAREVGTEGMLGGQAEVEGVSGTWRDLTDNVNYMASNLTDQVRNIAQVTTAVANGDLSQKITVQAKGEVAELADTINTMVDQLSSFADEVTRVAKEVGTEGRLGGQAEVEGVSGTWRGLTENVNQLAGNLTTQVRNIAQVSTAVTQGDLTRSISVEAQGEVAELKDNINQMIANLRDTTKENAEQDWLKTNLARISSLMQGQRDLETVSSLIMSELTPTVSAQIGAFFLAEPLALGEVDLRLIASYGYRGSDRGSNSFRLGEGLVGQAAVERQSILITDPPADYITVSSGLGDARPANIIVLPVVFEDEVLAVIELASFRAFGELNLQFLEQLGETIGVTLNTIIANRRTTELLEGSQGLTQELQQTNEELQEKAAQLSRQNRDIEVKTEQLALSSRYKSEFLANMSHELRTPLNSMLILSRLLADNDVANLTEKQVEHASTIHSAGTDLLTLINDILDLSKVEAGKMEVQPAPVGLGTIRSYVERTFAPVAEQQGLAFEVQLASDLPETITTDGHRLQQVLKNLLSNAFKFTEVGDVTLVVERGPLGVSFTVADTGVGIPADKLKAIFEAFQQAEGGTSRRFGGTGLGLSISREIARLLGGRLEVTSAEGEGSRFTLELPVQSTAPPPDAVLGPAADVPAAGGNGQSPPADAPQEAIVMPAGVVEDDRDHIDIGDRVLLVVGDDRDYLAWALQRGRERGFKVIGELRPEIALALSHAFGLSVVLLRLGADNEARVLKHLKRHPQTRHVPVFVQAPAERCSVLLRAGAAGQIDIDAHDDEVEAAFSRVELLLVRPEGRLLVVGDDSDRRDRAIDLAGAGDDVRAIRADPSDAPELLATEPFDCVVLAGSDRPLRALVDAGVLGSLPVVVWDEGGPPDLAGLPPDVVLKHAGSAEELLDQTVLHLHRAEARLPTGKQRMLDRLRGGDSVFADKQVLVVDDDVRNVFALASALETHGVEVLFAENGRDGIEMLRQNPRVDLVLMDVMMPEMDGYAATREVRSMPAFGDLPIVALTAKAMRGDRERSIASGASDYIAKPVDVHQLLSLMRPWLYR